MDEWVDATVTDIRAIRSLSKSSLLLSTTYGLGGREIMVADMCQVPRARIPGKYSSRPTSIMDAPRYPGGRDTIGLAAI